MEYFNPGAGRPDIGWKPDGALGGYIYGDQERQYNNAMSLQDLMSQIRAHMETGKLEDYRLDAPVRQAERGSKMSKAEYETAVAQAKLNDPNYIRSGIEGEIGENTGKKVAGRIAAETADSKIGLANTEHAVKQKRAFLESSLQTLTQAEQTSPMLAQMAWQQIRASAPETLRGGLPEQYTPAVRKAMETALVKTPSHLQKLEEETTKGAEARKLAGVQGANALAVERERQAGQDWRAQLSAEQKAKVSKIEGVLAKLFEKSLQGPLTPQEQQAFQIGQQILNNMNASRASGPAMGYQFLNPGAAPGFPTPAPVPAPGAPAPQAAPRTFKNEAEAKASGYKGEAIINGRRARID